MSDELPQSATELSRFILDMHESLITHPEQWENRTLPGFLEALAAVVESYEQGCKNLGYPLPPVEVWPALGSILSTASIYE
jgi:hypothetical protein